MDTSLFWTHKNVLETMDVDCGFSLFSGGHLAWLAGIVLWAVATATIYRKLDLHQRDCFRKIMAIGIVLLETAKLCAMGLSHLDVSEHLPIHLCSLAGLFIVIDAMWPNTAFIHQLFLYAFNVGALMALICSSATIYPFWNFYSIHIFVFHGYLLVYSVMRLAAGEYKPTYGGVWISAVLIVALGLPLYAIDGIFGVNYMFLGHPSDISLLIGIWDICAPIGGRFLYALFLGGLGVILMHLLYFFYRLPAISRYVIRRTKKEHSLPRG